MLIHSSGRRARKKGRQLKGDSLIVVLLGVSVCGNHHFVLAAEVSNMHFFISAKANCSLPFSLTHSLTLFWFHSVGSRGAQSINRIMWLI